MLYLAIIVLIIFAFLYKRNPVYFGRLLFILIVSTPPLYALVTEGIGGLMIIIKLYAVIIPIGLIVVGISNIDDGVSSLRGKYFDNKTIFKFLLIQIFTPGFSDQQKIKKIKQINELAIYGKEQHRLSNERRAKKEEQAEIDRLDWISLKCNEYYEEVADTISKEMSEYINSDYINLEFVVPTRENVYGHILINAKTNKSIIKLTCRAPSKKDDKSFKAYKVETDQVLIPTSTPNEFFYSNSSRVSVKKAKKYLLKYFKSNPTELDKWLII